MPPTFDPAAAAQPGSGLFGLPHDPEAHVQVIPVPFDATTSYRPGAARAPEAVLAASRQVDLFDRVNGRPYEAGIVLRPAHPRIAALQEEAAPLARAVIARGGEIPAGRAGDELRRALARVNALGAELDRIVRAEAEDALERGRLPVVLGGDHAVPFGAIAAASERFPGLGLLHFDAHADLRVAYEGFTRSHASILHNVLAELDGVARVVQVGVRDLSEEEHETIRASNGRVRTLFDDEWSAARLAGADLRVLVREALFALPDTVYVTFDVDGLEPALCPNTGTPVPGGLSWSEALLWLDELARSGRRVVGADLVEVAPAPAGSGPGSGGAAGAGIDEVVGARLLYKLIGTALRARPGKNGAGPRT